jgi:hypothetical protein
MAIAKEGEKNERNSLDLDDVCHTQKKIHFFAHAFAQNMICQVVFDCLFVTTLNFICWLARVSYGCNR